VAFTQIVKKFAMSHAGRGAARGADTSSIDIYNIEGQLGFQKPPQTTSPQRAASNPQMSPEESEKLLQTEMAELGADLAYDRMQRDAARSDAAQSPDRATQQPGRMQPTAGPEEKVTPKQYDRIARMLNEAKFNQEQEAAFGTFEKNFNADMEKSPLMKNREHSSLHGFSRKTNP
jgi:hypothetical protein